MKNIILIGYMATGKTEVAKRLSRKLGYELICTDTLIEAKTGRSIPAIFAQDGEEKFRELESQVLDDLTGIKRAVISTGGGIVLREGNAAKLKSLGKVILLEAEPEIIDARLKHLANRPLLNIKNRQERLKKIEEMLKIRNPKYAAAADFKIDTSKISLDEVVQKIVDYMGE